MGNLQKFFKLSAPGWLSVIVGSGWQALEHYDKIAKVLPLPPWCLIAVGAVWVSLTKIPPPPDRAPGESKRSEVVMIRERTTIEREYVVRREG